MQAVITLYADLKVRTSDNCVVKKWNTTGVNVRKKERCYGGRRGDCVAWLHLLMAVQTDTKWNVTSAVQGKDLLTACINTGIAPPPVIECSLKKSTQWIPQEFSNALLQCVYSPIYFTMTEGVFCTWRDLYSLYINGHTQHQRSWYYSSLGGWILSPHGDIFYIHLYGIIAFRD